MLGENLKRIRNEKNMSLRKLSEVASISKSRISEVENNKSNNVTYETLERIADALDVTVYNLLGESLEHKVKQRLIELNLTMDDLALKLNVGINTLTCLFENDPLPHDYLLVKKIAKLLHMNPQILISALALQEVPGPEEVEYIDPKLEFTVVNDNIYKEELSEYEIFHLAAKMIGYEEALSQKDIDNIKDMMKILLIKSK